MAPQAQHILGAVEELGEAIELTVAKVNGCFVGPHQGGLAAVGPSQEGLQQLCTGWPVPSSPHKQGLSTPHHCIFQPHGQAGVQEGHLGAQPHLLAVQAGKQEGKVIAQGVLYYPPKV